jgi:hypothetical protein
VVEIAVPHDIGKYKLIATVVPNGHNSGNGSVISYHSEQLPVFHDFRDQLLPAWIKYVLSPEKQNWCTDCNEKRYRDYQYLLVQMDWGNFDQDWFEERMDCCGGDVNYVCKWTQNDIAKLIPLLGTTCLEKYIPPSAFAMIKLLEHLRTFRKERKLGTRASYKDYSVKHLMFNVRDYIASIRAVAVKQSRYIATYRKWEYSTSLSALNNLMYIDSGLHADVAALTQEHYEFADKVIAYIKEVELSGEKTSDKYLSLFQILKHEDFVGHLYTNVAVAYEEYVAYSDKIERSRVSLPTNYKPDPKASGTVMRSNGVWYGEIGEKIQALETVVLSKSKPFPSRFNANTCVMVRLKTKCGCVLSYCSNENDVPPDSAEVLVSGTIKGHSFYNMTRQTELNRVVVSF